MREPLTAESLEAFIKALSVEQIVREHEAGE